ncbi:MAG: DUF2207 domain-containing protein [Ilumatobacteraceae bacterium]
MTLGRFSVWRHLVVLLVIAACAALAALGIIGGRGERFDSKQVTVQPVGRDGVRIREVVDQDFGSRRKHGYERTIPNDFGEPTDITASSPDASADVHVIDEGSETVIRLGDPDTTVRGQHRYVLSYTLPDARLSSGELALDIIGTDESLETGRFEVVVIGMELTGTTCNVGDEGESGGCELERDGDVYRTVISPLEPGDGITIGGSITTLTESAAPQVPDLPERRTDHSGTVAMVMIPLGLASAGAVFTWARRRGRNVVFSGGAADAAYGELPDPSVGDTALGAGTTLVADDQMDELATIEFVPPKGIAPWEGSVLLSERISNDTVSAWFSGLVSREAITLEKDDDDLVLIPGPRRGELDPDEATHVDAIFRGRDRVELGKYDKKFATAWTNVRKELAGSIGKSGWWRHLPPGAATQIRSVRSMGIVIAVLVLFVFGIGSFITALLGVFNGIALAVVFGIVVPAVVAYFMYRTLLRVRSATGSALTLRAESFRRFLEASEGNHVDWAWKHGLLREYSAWAVALGAADAWNKALGRSSVPPAEAAAMTHPLLVYSMASSISSSHTAPSSSGSGGGFSGGSVGGGGGGGSSGSW